MDATESALRALKDRIAAVLGEIDETMENARRKNNLRRLSNAARELHDCADEMQDLLMRIQPR